jgi:hypothetical protein
MKGKSYVKFTPQQNKYLLEEIKRNPLMSNNQFDDLERRFRFHTDYNGESVKLKAKVKALGRKKGIQVRVGSGSHYTEEEVQILKDEITKSRLFSKQRLAELVDLLPLGRSPFGVSVKLRSIDPTVILPDELHNATDSLNAAKGKKVTELAEKAVGRPRKTKVMENQVPLPLPNKIRLNQLSVEEVFDLFETILERLRAVFTTQKEELDTFNNLRDLINRAR